MLTTTAANLMINEELPEDLRSYGRVWDKGGTEQLLAQLAERYPEKYADVVHGLMQHARKYAYLSGGNSFRLAHLKPGQSTLAARQRIRTYMEQLDADDKTPDAEKQQALEQFVDKEASQLLKDLYKESLDGKNPLAYQVLSGARGNPTNLRSLLGFDAAYEDHHGNRIPVPILRNYSEGLSFPEYFAGTFGARRGVLDVKRSTGDAGYYAKQLVQAAHRLLVSATDDDSDRENVNRRGLPVDVTDPDSVGGLLALPVGPYPRNTVITPKVLANLKAQGVEQLLVRSPTVGGPADGGVYARDVGVRERGALPGLGSEVETYAGRRLSPIGDYVGIAGGQTLSEMLTQGSLSSKHSGGIAGAGPRGFALINQLSQVPETFNHGAAHAQLDGTVGAIRPAPQGGSFIMIHNQEHYVPPGVEIKVKQGDVVEAGDVMSGGLPNPAQIVQHKGVGEGRRYFVDAMRKAFKDSGMKADRRNIELVARGLINHVRLTDVYENYAPDDIVPYNKLERNWSPRPGFAVRAPASAVGEYLEKPTLHYTIGTRIQPSMLPLFKQFGIQNVTTHRDPPPFVPEMQRAATSISTDDDWQTRMLGSGQKATLLDAAHRGDVSDTAGTSFVPALIAGKDFGKLGPTKGWQ